MYYYFAVCLFASLLSGISFDKGCISVTAVHITCSCIYCNFMILESLLLVMQASYVTNSELTVVNDFDAP